MGTTDINRWIGIGLLGLPVYGVLTFLSSLNPQPDPNTHYDAWARFVTTDFYVFKHLFASLLGTIFVIFGTFALGAYLARSRAGRMGLLAMAITVFGTALFLAVGGVSTFAVPEQGQAQVLGIDAYREMPPLLAETVMTVTFVVGFLLMLVGNALLGVAVWRSGMLPRWAGAIWTVGYSLPVLGMLYALLPIGADATPATVPIGAVLLVISGGWIAYSVLRGPSAEKAAGVVAQPRVQ